MSLDNFSEEDVNTFAVTVTAVDGAWDVREFDDRFTSLATSIKKVRSLRAESAAFAFLCVDDDYFVIVRPVPGNVRLFLSDATMAVDDDFAAEILERSGIDIPDIDPDDLDDVDGYADGDFEILADLGISGEVLGVIADNQEDWPSDMLLRIAGELGFGDELEDIVNGEN